MLKQQTFCVYALLDCRKQAKRHVFYIGKTKDENRGATVWRHCNKGFNKRKYRTNKNILESGIELKMKVLRSGLSEDKALELETFLIKALRKFDFDLVNLTNGGEGTTGYKHSADVCKKRSLRMKQNNPMKNPESARKTALKKMVPVLQISKNDISIQKFSGAIEAERSLGIPHQNIISCCQGKRNVAGGYKWSYAQC